MNLAFRRPSARVRRVRWLWMRAGLPALILWSLTAMPLAAQEGGRVTLTGVDDQAFPRVSLYIDVFTAAGTPVLDLTPNAVALTEDQQPVTIQSLQTDTSRPLALLLALDRSTDAVTWAAVQSAAESMIGGLRDGDQVSLVTVFDEVEVVQPFTSDRAAAIAALTAVTPGGDFSAINPALVQAVQQFDDSLSLRRAVVLVADAPDNISGLTADVATGQIAAAGVPVSVVGYGDRVQSEPSFVQFAQATGGRSVFVADANALQAALTGLLTDMQQGYRVDFVSALRADSSPHTARLQVNDRNVTASAAAPFVARSGTVTVTLPGLSAGQPLGGVVNLTAQAEGPAAISAMEFRVDEQLIGTASPGETVAWDTTTVAAGRHTLRVLATDLSGNTGEAAADVLVTAGRTRMDLLAVQGMDFPLVVAYVDVFGTNGLPVAGLDGRSFALREDDRTVDATLVTAQMDTSQPLQVVLVLDRSVDASEWGQLRSAANSLIDGLREQDQAAVYAFAGGVLLVQPPTGNQDALQNALASIEPVPPAAQPVADNSLYQAILDATNMALSLPPGRRSVVVLTDGLDNTGLVSVDQMVQELQARPVPVHILGFGAEGPVAGGLAGLALLSGGNSVTVAGASALRGPAQTLIQLIAQGYRLSYGSGLQADDQPHALTVNLNTAGLEAEAAGTFVAARRPLLVTILGVSEGQTIGGQVDLRAEADAAAPVVSVEYRLNGETLAQTQDIAALVRWNSQSVAPGAYTLEVIATDAVGNQGSASVSFTVVPPVTVVASLDPRSSDGDIVAGDDVTVQAEVTVLEGRAAVEFYVGNVLVGTDDRAPFEVRFDSGEFGPGNQTVTVVARDEAGRQAVGTLDLVFVAPPTPTPDATAVAAAGGSGGLGASLPGVRGINWGRWLGVAGFIAVLLALWAVIAAALGSVRAAAATKTLTPMRLALSNMGNVATAYLLRGDDPAGALTYRFSLQGQPLGRPPVARVSEEGSMAALAGTGRRVTVPGVNLAGAASGISMPKNMGEIGEKISEASGMIRIVTSLIMTVTYLLPPALARPLRTVAMQLRRGQMITRRVESVQRQVGRLSKATGASGQAGNGTQEEMEVAEQAPAGTAQATQGPQAGPSAGATFSAAAGSAVAGAGRAANKLFDLSATATRQMGDQAAALVGAGAAAGRQWVYVPPVNPGETVTVEVMVGAAGKLSGSQYLSFRLLSRAVGEESLQPIAEEGTVRVTGSSPWLGLRAWIVIGVAVVVAAILAWLLIGLIF